MEKKLPTALKKIVHKLPFPLKSIVKILRAQIYLLAGSEKYAYPAINDLDRQVLRILPREGTYLEIGGNDGYSQSNTYYLDKVRGWHGILIEPLPVLHRISRIHRSAVPFNVACSDVAGKTEIVNRGLMTVSVELLEPGDEREDLKRKTKSKSVATMTLTDVLEQSRLTDLTFMSIDVEGAELPVLKGLDLDRYCPQYLLVETSNAEAVSSVLKRYMTLSHQLSHHDYLYTRLGVGESPKGVL